MTQPHNPFTHHGPLHHNHPLFRGRKELVERLEQSCLERSDSFIILYGGRSNGKTSLLRRLEQRLREQANKGVAVCQVSLPHANTIQVYRHLATQAAYELPQHQPLPNVADATTLLDFFETALAPPTIKRFVLLLDMLGALDKTTRVDLAYALSDLHTRRFHSPALTKIQVLIVGGLELHTLVVSEASSLHNLCEEIYLPDLDQSAAIALVSDGLKIAGVEPSLSIEMGRMVYRQVEGHPYLTQRLGAQLAGYHASNHFVSLSDIQRAVAALGDNPPPLLQQLQDDLRKYGLEDAARRLLSAPPPFDRLDSDMARLELLGLAKQVGEYWGPRNPLLATVFRRRLGLPAPVPRQPLPPWVPVLVNVPGGHFLMGSKDSDRMVGNDEKPQHSLDLTVFWIGRTPITNAQFRPFVEGNGYTNRVYWTADGWAWRQRHAIIQPLSWKLLQQNSDDYPVTGVSWFEAVAYCRWLSAQTGHPFRLPSEAEWEKAARGPEGRIWPWGNIWQPQQCNSAALNLGHFSPVSSFPGGASYYGALDMAGNAWEWCATQHGKVYPYRLENEWTDQYLEVDEKRVIRSGAFYSDQTSVRGAYRDFNHPYNRSQLTGLRVVSYEPLPDTET